jgi:osmotically-inducible protein OsmY
MPGFAVGALVGAVLSYFLDPQSGTRRRHVVRDRTLALARRSTRKSTEAARLMAAEAYGVKQKVTHLREEEKEYDDVTLARKVETEIFRRPDVPKGDINVSATDGVVALRGQIDRPELIDDLVERARSVHGVRDVENLLHLPGTPAPMHQ